MRTWKVIFVCFWRSGERVVVVVGSGWVWCCSDGSCGCGLGLLSGCERIVTRGTKVFQLGQVEVSIRAAQTFVDGAEMKVELPMWRIAFLAEMVGVERVAFVGSWRAGMVDGGSLIFVGRWR